LHALGGSEVNRVKPNYFKDFKGDSGNWVAFLRFEMFFTIYSDVAEWSMAREYDEFFGKFSGVA
jgi:hypothetical protein